LVSNEEIEETAPCDFSEIPTFCPLITDADGEANGKSSPTRAAAGVQIANSRRAPAFGAAGTTLPTAYLEDSANLSADEHNETTIWASGEDQLALTIAAAASLVAKLPRWWLCLHSGVA
jgi:hypothetical protein